MENISDEEQRNRFRRFSKAHFTITGRLPLAMPIFFAFCSGLLLSIPDFDKVILWSSGMLNLWIPWTMLCPYLLVSYQNQPTSKQTKIYQILRYLPISRKQLRRELTECVWRFLWRFCLITVLLHMIVCCFAGELHILAILQILLNTLVQPMVFGILFIWGQTRT